MFTEPTISCLHVASVGNLVHTVTELYREVMRLQNVLVELDRATALATHGTNVRYSSKHLTDLTTDDLQPADGLMVTPMLAWSRTTEFDALKPSHKRIRHRREVLTLASTLQLLQPTSVTLIICDPQMVSHLPAIIFTTRTTFIAQMQELGRRWNQLLAHLCGELNMQRLLHRDNSRPQDTVRVIEAVVRTDATRGKTVAPTSSAWSHATHVRAGSNDSVIVISTLTTSQTLSTFNIRRGCETMNLSLALAQTLTALRAVGCYRLPAYFHGLFNETTKTWVRAIAFNVHSSIVYDVLADRLSVHTTSVSASDIREFVTRGLSCSPAQQEESACAILKYAEVQIALSHMAAL